MEFKTVDYTNFIVDYTVSNGELADEQKLNQSSLRLKKELNNVYNIQQIINSKKALSWRGVETYLPGEIVYNISNDKHYRSLKTNYNEQPDLNNSYWEVITIDDLSAKINNFVGLNDTPSSYNSSAGNILVVNNLEDGIEFVDSIDDGIY